MYKLLLPCYNNINQLKEEYSHMERYIKLYTDVIEPEVCDGMIEMFNNNPDQTVHRDNALMDFSEINLIEHDETWSQYNKYLSYQFRKVLEQYKVECDIKTPNQWPEKYEFEQYRMKQYEPNIGRFDQHVDVGNFSTARRFLVLIAYLDSGESGTTSFDSLGIDIPRTRGSVLVFPPHWTYPHAGTTPVGERKHIVGTYLHYV